MNMDRRSFVTAMFGSAVAIPLLARLDLIEAHNGQDRLEDFHGPVWREIQDETLREAWRIFVAHAPAFSISQGGPLGLNMRRDGRLFDRIVAAKFGATDPLGDQLPKVPLLEYGIKEMALKCRALRLNAYAPLEHPRVVERSLMAHNVLRMVVVWDAVESRYLTLFHVLGSNS